MTLPIENTTRGFGKLLPAFDFLALLAFPVILYFVNNSWTFLPPFGWIDPYVYTGYMLDLRKYIEVFGPTYYESRLPWLLLGSAVHSLASFEVANLILRFVVFYCGTFALYVTVRTIWRDRLAATLAALLLGTNTYLLSAIAWDYPDGAGIALLLVTLACATLAIEARRWRALLFAAGAAAMTTISVQVFLVVLIPLPFVWYVLLNWHHRKRPLHVSALFIALGGLTAYVVYGLIHVWLGGEFHYLGPQVNAALTLDPAAYKARSYAWLTHAAWLAFPVLGAVASFVLLATAALDYRTRRSLASMPGPYFAGACAALLMIAAATLFVYLQLFHGADLQFDYYANYLLPFALLAIAAALAVGLTNLQGAWRPAAGVLAAIVFVSPLATGAPWFLPACPLPCSVAGVHGFVLLLTAALLVAAVATRSVGVALAGLFALSLLNIGVADYRRILFEDRAAMRDLSFMVMDADAALPPFNQDGKLRFWYAGKDRLGGVYTGVASLHLWAFRLVSEDFPNRTSPVGGPNPAALRIGETMAIFSAREDAVSAGNALTEPDGYRLDLLEQKRFSRRSQAFNLFVVRVVAAGFRPATRLPLDEFVPVHRGRVNAGPQGSVFISTSAMPYHYAAVLPLTLPEPGQAQGPAYVRIRARVTGAPVEFGLATPDQSAFLDQISMKATKAPAEVFLRIDELSDAGYVVVRTFSLAQASRVEVHDVTLYLPEAISTPAENRP